MTIDTWEACPGIAVGGGIYAMLVATVVIGVRIFYVGISPSFSHIGAMIVGVAVSWIAGMIVGGLVAILSLLLVTTFNVSLGYPFSACTASAMAAGLSGFAITGFAAVGILSESSSFFNFGIALLCGPFLCMICCQTIADYQTEKYRRIREQEENGIVTIEHDNRRASGVNEKPFQLSIRNLLVLTGWLAALATLVRAMEESVPIELCAIMIGSYIVLQAIVFPVSRLIRPLLRRRLERSVRVHQMLLQAERERTVDTRPDTIHHTLEG